MTKRTLTLGALALLSGGCGHLLGHGDATAFSPPGGGFSVQAPATPTAAIQTIHTAFGPLPQHLFTAQPLDGGAYVVTYVDYPIAIKDDSPSVVLARACGSAADILGSTVQNERTISLNGNPGRDFTSDGDKSDTQAHYYLHERVYLVGTRLYQVMTVHTRDDANDARDAAFLSSFRLSR